MTARYLLANIKYKQEEESCMAKLAQSDITGCIKREYVDAYQTIRTIATILVVVGHCSTLALPLANGELDIYPDGLQIKLVIREISRMIYSFHMPLFMILSGATFAVSFQERTGNMWISRRAKRLLIPFLLCAFFVVLPIRMFLGYYDQPITWKNIFFDYILTLDVNYLWYVLVLYEINGIVFLFRKGLLTRDIRKQAFILLCALFCSVLQFLVGKTLPFQFDRAIRFSFWFYLGILLEYNRDSFKKRASTKNIVLAALTWVAGYTLHTWFETIIAQEHYSTLVIVGIKALKMLIRYAMMELGGSLLIILLAFRIKPITNKWLETIAQNSFAIYLYHCPCIWLMKKAIHILVPAERMTNILYLVCICVLIILSIVGSIQFHAIVQCMKQRLGSVCVRNG